MKNEKNGACLVPVSELLVNISFLCFRPHRDTTKQLTSIKKRKWRKREKGHNTYMLPKRKRSLFFMHVGCESFSVISVWYRDTTKQLTYMKKRKSLLHSGGHSILMSATIANATRTTYYTLLLAPCGECDLSSCTCQVANATVSVATIAHIRVPTVAFATITHIHIPCIWDVTARPNQSCMFPYR